MDRGFRPPSPFRLRHSRVASMAICFCAWLLVASFAVRVTFLPDRRYDSTCYSGASIRRVSAAAEPPVGR
jgi:hypothetical protein